MSISKDEYLLSLLLDGRLSEAEAAELRGRLDADEALRERYAAMGRLQRLSAAIAQPTAGFDASDVLGRAESATSGGRNVWWMRTGVAAAAVLMLALTHGGAYLLGAKRGGDIATDGQRGVVLEPGDEFTSRADPIANTEALLTRASNLDPNQSHEELRGTLIGLRRNMRALPTELARLADARPPRRARASQLAEVLVHLEIAFEEVKDPGFLSIAVASIAKKSLSGEARTRFVPANARSFSRMVALEGGRFRVMFVGKRDGMPRLVTDEGTLEELKLRHDVEFVAERKK